MMSRYQEEEFPSIQEFLNSENETIGKGELEFFDQGEQCEVCTEDGLDECQGHIRLESGTYL
jgi:hypothetical protein